MSYLLVCDFDDTLVRCHDLFIIATNKLTGNIINIPSEMWNEHIVDINQYDYDWSQFDTINNNFTVIQKSYDTIIRWRETFGLKSIVILTSRHSPNGPKEFLHRFNLEDIEVVALGEKANCVSGKADWIRSAIIDRQLKHIEYLEDNTQFIKAVRKLRKEFPFIDIKIRKIKNTDL